MTSTPVLQVRIHNIDYTLSESGPLDNSSLYRVPVVRIFGISSTGKKACVYIHQVYPYVFVEYTGNLDPNSINKYITLLQLSLNHAIAISLKRNPASPSSQFVRAILLVKGVHFYGFHSSYTPFLKIYLADPSCLPRTVALLQSGAVMKTSFCVYESHISFALQFMCDFGLYGCGWIDLAEAWKRGNDQENQDQLSFKASPHPRQSRMELEVDVAAYHILNRHLLTARNIHHELTIPEPPLPDEPLVLSVRELWEDERRRRRERGLNPTPEIPVDPSENSRGPGGDWAAEARWWNEIRMKIEKERGQDEIIPLKDWERWVPTTYESIDALWSDEWKRTDENHRTAANPFFTLTSAKDPCVLNGKIPKVDVDVDERLLSSQNMTQWVDVDYAEADWEKVAGEEVMLDEERDNDQETILKDDVDSVAGEPVELSPSRSDSVQHTPIASINITSKMVTPKKSVGHNVFEDPDLLRPLATPTKPERQLGSLCFRTAVGNSQQGTSASRKRPHTIIPLSFPTSSVDLKTLEAAKNSLGSLLSDAEAEDVFGSKENAIRQIVTQNFDTEVSSPTKRRRLNPRPKAHFSSLSSVRQNVASQFSGINQLTDSEFLTQTKSSIFVYALIPPTTSELLLKVDDFGIPHKLYQDPYYSNEADAHSKEYAGLLFHIQGGNGLSSLRHWDDDSSAYNGRNGKKLYSELVATGVTGWEYAGYPPSSRETKRWLKQDANIIEKRKNQAASSQIEGPTQANIYGLKTTPTAQSDKSTREKQNMTVLCLEVFAPSRPGLVPDPGTDEIVAAFYSFQDSDVASADDPSTLYQSGIVTVENEQLNPNRLRGIRLDAVPSELELLNRIIDVVVDFDPDIIVGWEIQSASWGYLSTRGKHYGYDVGQLLSRAPGRQHSAGTSVYEATHTTTFKVIGRHVLNVWRIMRAEQSLETYTFENTAFYLLQQRVPLYTSGALTRWYQSSNPTHGVRTLKYFMRRTTMVLQMLDAAETVTKTAEFARVFGVDFYSVISRGSQFKVESFMLRIAKPESFVLLSPSKEDVGKQNAAECMPLIMEPQSDFYNGPLIVLDFQSLYPSIMIAYNYCYSTCLGRIVEFKGQYKFGVTELQQPAGLLQSLQDHINVAPNGIMYTKPEVRKGLLGRMLKELLDTRVMVKQAMKGVKGDKASRRILDARQLGLKYISNVTYGYTSATFSGRMPAVEIADSIVQSGRETLEKAIATIESTKKWGAQVVYGDTDSLFIYLRGKTKEQAFRIGYDISDAITAMNPAPIKLKFEKVYLPCVLLAKKRYVGFKYESPDDKEPTFDAKGIETVRRDGVLAQRKMTETCLKILFRTQDLSEVKNYCCDSWSKILANKAPIQDFIFAKEVRLGTYSDKGLPPPGVVVAARKKMFDGNNDTQYGDRVPYVIIRGDPGSKLVDRAVSPEELFEDRNKRLDGVYYITRVLIPPLERIFNLVGADVRAWYDEMPRTVTADPTDRQPTPASPGRRSESVEPFGDSVNIDNHFSSSKCLTCMAVTYDGVCDACRADAQNTVIALMNRIRRAEGRLQATHTMCTSCTSSVNVETIECVSLDCPWLFARKKAEAKVDLVTHLRELLFEMEDLINDEGWC